MEVTVNIPDGWDCTGCPFLSFNQNSRPEEDYGISFGSGGYFTCARWSIRLENRGIGAKACANCAKQKGLKDEMEKTKREVPDARNGNKRFWSVSNTGKASFLGWYPDCTDAAAAWTQGDLTLIGMLKSEDIQILPKFRASNYLKRLQMTTKTKFVSPRASQVVEDISEELARIWTVAYTEQERAQRFKALFLRLALALVQEMNLRIKHQQGDQE